MQRNLKSNCIDAVGPGRWTESRVAYNKIKIAADGNGLILTGSNLDDMLIGGIGNQFLYGSTGNDLLIAGTGNQQLFGGSGDDTLVGGAGDQQLYGGSGNDTVVAGRGNQYLDGGSGIDTLDFSRLGGRVEIEQGARTANVYDTGSGVLLNANTILSFDHIIGSDHNDVFKGQMQRGTSFDGGVGDDLFLSKNGGDTMTGGDGADTFAWARKFLDTGIADRVTDFEVGVDRLDLADFLGQGYLNPTYSQVVRLSDVVEADGSHSTKVTALVNERWADVVGLG
jgi:Ca2+-binding RTX toxin-like protein